MSKTDTPWSRGIIKYRQRFNIKKLLEGLSSTSSMNVAPSSSNLINEGFSIINEGSILIIQPGSGKVPASPSNQ